MRDKASVQSKLDRIKQGGFDRLQILSDFDYTISSFSDVSGVRKGPTSHGIIENCGLLSTLYHDGAAELKESERN